MARESRKQPAFEYSFMAPPLVGAPGGQAGFYPGEQVQPFYQPDWNAIFGPLQTHVDARAEESRQGEARADVFSPQSIRQRRRGRRQERRENVRSALGNLGDAFQYGIQNLFNPVSGTGFNRYAMRNS